MWKIQLILENNKKYDYNNLLTVLFWSIQKSYYIWETQVQRDVVQQLERYDVINTWMNEANSSGTEVDQLSMDAVALFYSKMTDNVGGFDLSSIFLISVFKS